MNKVLLIFIVFFLIIVTTITKNSTKKLEEEIFLVKENISVLKEKYDFFLLEYNYLSSPKKLMEYQLRYFEKDLTNVDINEINKIIIKNDELFILDSNKKKAKVEE